MIPVGAIAALLVFALRQRGAASGTPATLSANLKAVDPTLILQSLFFLGTLNALSILIATLVGSLATGYLVGLWATAIAMPWLAWRVCYPLGLRRTGWLLLWLTPQRSTLEAAGRRRLLAVALGEPLRTAARKKVLPVNGWTACAAVVEAERNENLQEASAWVDGLLALPLDRALSRGVRRYGIEVIAGAACRREDWREVARRASLGRGRGVRFLRLVSRAHLKGDVPRGLLWSAWAMAPRRTSSYRTLLAALQAQRSAKPTSVAASGDSAPGPWRRHLDLLERGARGEEIALAALIDAAGAWDAAVSPAGTARFTARGLELGSTRSRETFETLRESILLDLAALARGARGVWPSAAVSGVAAELRERLRDQTFGAVERIAQTRRIKRLDQLGDPLDEWRLWLRFRAAAESLAARFGEQALRTAWYGGAQLAAWNWPCHLLERHGERAAWACHVMFRWTVEMAERCEDAEAARVNRKNVLVAQQRMHAA